MSYYQIILKVLEIADKSPDLIDFYWPQILHIHTLESANRTPSSLMKLGAYMLLYKAHIRSKMIMMMLLEYEGNGKIFLSTHVLFLSLSLSLSHNISLSSLLHSVTSSLSLYLLISNSSYINLSDSLRTSNYFYFYFHTSRCLSLHLPSLLLLYLSITNLNLCVNFVCFTSHHPPLLTPIHPTPPSPTHPPHHRSSPASAACYFAEISRSRSETLLDSFCKHG